MPDLFPLQLLLATFAGWVNRHQAQAIDYLIEENRVLREQLGGKRLRLTNDQRRRLAAKGHALGRRLLMRVATIVTPDTIMRWHRRLIAARWTYSSKRVGRPGIMKAIRALIVRMATDNSNWGYCRIQGELKKLDHRVARATGMVADSCRPTIRTPRSGVFRRSSARGSSVVGQERETCGRVLGQDEHLTDVHALGSLCEFRPTNCGRNRQQTG